MGDVTYLILSFFWLFLLVTYIVWGLVWVGVYVSVKGCSEY